MGTRPRAGPPPARGGWSRRFGPPPGGDAGNVSRPGPVGGLAGGDVNAALRERWWPEGRQTAIFGIVGLRSGPAVGFVRQGAGSPPPEGLPCLGDEHVRGDAGPPPRTVAGSGIGRLPSAS